MWVWWRKYCLVGLLIVCWFGFGLLVGWLLVSWFVDCLLFFWLVGWWLGVWLFSGFIDCLLVCWLFVFLVGMLLYQASSAWGGVEGASSTVTNLSTARQPLEKEYAPHMITNNIPCVFVFGNLCFLLLLWICSAPLTSPLGRNKRHLYNHHHHQPADVQNHPECLQERYMSFDRLLNEMDACSKFVFVPSWVVEGVLVKQFGTGTILLMNPTNVCTTSRPRPKSQPKLSAKYLVIPAFIHRTTPCQRHKKTITCLFSWLLLLYDRAALLPVYKCWSVWGAN